MNMLNVKKILLDHKVGGGGPGSSKTDHVIYEWPLIWAQLQSEGGGRTRFEQKPTFDLLYLFLAFPNDKLFQYEIQYHTKSGYTWLKHRYKLNCLYEYNFLYNYKYSQLSAQSHSNFCLRLNRCLSGDH